MRPFAVVLVRPERPANIGAAARALKNFGFVDLRIVGATTALPGGAGHGEARALAWNSADVLDAARSFTSLEEAVDDLGLVAATSGRAEPGDVLLSPREFAEEVARLPLGISAGCVFGPEDSGLSNTEIDACRVRVRIPTAPAQPSLNLAQAVVILAYEVALAEAAAAPVMIAPPAEGFEPAVEGDVERLFARLRDLSLEAGFLNPQAPEHVLGEIRRLISRARPTRREITLLQGLVAQLQWAQRNGGVKK